MPGHVFVLISLFLFNGQVCVGKLLKEITLNVSVLNTQSLLVHDTHFLFYINDLSDVICNIPIYADDTTLV